MYYPSQFSPINILNIFTAVLMKFPAIWNIPPYVSVYWPHISENFSVSFFGVSKKINLRLKMGIMQCIIEGMIQQEIEVMGKREIRSF
jgi:hypothetical protein